MAKVTTKTGDTGLTRLLGREHVPKSDPRIALLGAVDEATSALGVARAYSSDTRVREIVLRVQCDLYVLMADVATPPQHRDAIGMTITPESVQWLEDVEAAFLAEVDIPNTFILPGGCLEGAFLDVARTVIRRAERIEARLVQRHLAANPDVLRYLNRVSDVIFILARVVEVRQGGSTLARPA
jgi:cob(I)alamin adenosyltransferase